MNWIKWRKLVPEKQVKALRDECHGSWADRLEEVYKNIDELKKHLDLLRRCLNAEFNVLRAANALLIEYKSHTPAERKMTTSFVEEYPEMLTKTVKHISKWSKYIEILNDRTLVLQKLRTEMRKVLRKEKKLLANYTESCLEVISSPPSRSDLLKELNNRTEMLSKQGMTPEDIEKEPKWAEIKAQLDRAPDK